MATHHKRQFTEWRWADIVEPLVLVLEENVIQAKPVAGSMVIRAIRHRFERSWTILVAIDSWLAFGVPRLERRPKLTVPIMAQRLQRCWMRDGFEDMRQLLVFAMSTGQIICEQPAVKCCRLLESALLLAL